MKRIVTTKKKIVDIITYKLTPNEVKQALIEYLENHESINEDGKKVSGIISNDCKIIFGEFTDGVPCLDIVNFYERDK